MKMWAPGIENIVLEGCVELIGELLAQRLEALFVFITSTNMS